MVSVNLKETTEKRQLIIGEVVYCDFGNPQGSKQAGRRPCIVLGNEKALKYSSVVTLVPLTSKLKPHIPVHIRIKTGISCPSTALVEQMTCMPIDKIELTDGHISKDELNSLKIAIMMQLGI